MGLTILVAVIALLVGAAVTLVVRRTIVSNRVQTAEGRAAKLVSDAELEAETKVRTSLAEVRSEIAAMRRDAEEDLRIRREEIVRTEDRLARREEGVEARAGELRKHQEELERV